MNARKGMELIIAILICQLAGVIGSVFTFPAITEWYSELIKPTFTPPSWVFGPAWITLYTLMGIALFVVWQERTNKRIQKGILLFGIQLALNTGWSVLFFGLRQPFYAFIEIILLWLVLAFTLREFLKINKTAAYLLLPYLAWVSLAMALNYSVWVLNG
ncbi:MAG: tryptophan-rich sensory protein [Candidatus Diapherotrites archaeon]|nr:tryptophan-rich sensory protein [Candidatus Diapherotrites archaeon]